MKPLRPALTALVLVFALGLAAVGCGGGATGPPGSTPASAPVTEPGTTPQTVPGTEPTGGARPRLLLFTQPG